MIGAPGSGKSTVAARLAEMFDAAVISTDAIRSKLWGDESVQGDWAEIDKEIKRLVRCAGAMNRNIVIDATHARKKYRTHSAQMLRQAGYSSVIPFIVHPPLETCLERNAKRDRRVPQRVIIQMWNAINSSIKSIDKEFND